MEYHDNDVAVLLQRPTADDVPGAVATEPGLRQRSGRARSHWLAARHDARALTHRPALLPGIYNLFNYCMTSTYWALVSMKFYVNTKK